MLFGMSRSIIAENILSKNQAKLEALGAALKEESFEGYI